MKSIIFLLLTACCLFPFSSATFTSENPIILPTTTHDDNIVLLPVRDVDGLPLKIGEKYIINGPMIGSGPVYWGNSSGDTPCPNAVLQHNSAQGNLGNGTAVKFFVPNAIIGDEVLIGIDINIMFSVEKSNPCADQTVWKVGEYQYVVTGGTLGSESNVFKIQEYDGEVKVKNAYKLMYCPPHYQCEDVCTIRDNGNIRLAIFPTGAPPFVFLKAKNA